MSLESRFWSMVRVAGPCECWEWTGHKNRSGYGTIGLGTRVDGNALAHRVSFDMHNDTPAGEMSVLHRCDNRGCVNPSHLFLGTQADNIRDMDRKGRRRTVALAGERHWAAKLTAEIVSEIRRRHAGGETGLALAREFGVASTNISAIVNHQTWKNA